MTNAAHAANPSHLEHPHSSGTFMFETSIMRMNMGGLRTGKEDVSTSRATTMPLMGGLGHMMVPTKMTMEMLMLMPMYNFTKSFNTMLMMQYINNSMDMTNNSESCTSTMETSGMGDVQVGLNYKFLDDYMAMSMDVSLPAGSINEKSTMNMNMIMNNACQKRDMFAPYAMQLGSGTYDITPALTFLGAYFSLRYGAQVSYKYRVGENDNGYTLGNEATSKLWVRKPFTGFTLSSELHFKRWGDIEGSDPKIDATTVMIMPSGLKMKGNPTAFTSNYGGKIVTFYLGVSVPISIFALGVDVSLPIYQDLNGLQMKRNLSSKIYMTVMF